MPADRYTHDFSYRLGDGGKFILGEVEFNHDKAISYKITDWSEPMPHKIMVEFTEFIDRVKSRFDEWGGLKQVKIIEKGFIEP